MIPLLCQLSYTAIYSKEKQKIVKQLRVGKANIHSFSKAPKRTLFSNEHPAKRKGYRAEFLPERSLKIAIKNISKSFLNQ